MATKAVREARARVAAIRKQIAEFDANAAKAAADAKALNEKAKRAAKRFARRPIIRALPMDEYAVMPNGLANYGLGYYGEGKDAKSEKALAEAIASGAVKVSLSQAGNAHTAKGAAMRTRYLSPATVKELARLDRLADAAEKRGREARARWKAAKKAAFERATDKPTVDEIAAAVAASGWIRRKIQGYDSFSTYKRQRLEDYDLRYALEHLAHAESGATTPCPCSTCAGARNQAEWKARDAARVKAREAEAKARARAEAKAPRVRFTCPACGNDSIAPLINGEVECQWGDRCGQESQASALRVKRMPKGTEARAIYDDEAQAVEA